MTDYKSPRRVLAAVASRKLMDWLDAHREMILRWKNTNADLAEMATRNLEFDITPCNVAGRLKAMGMARPRARRVPFAVRFSILTAEARVVRRILCIVVSGAMARLNLTDGCRKELEAFLLDSEAILVGEPEPPLAPPSISDVEGGNNHG